MVGFSMDRRNAIDVIKEILDRCPAIEGRSITLLPPKGNAKLSDTFQIHIRTCDPSLKACIETIAKEHSLVTKEDGNYFIIYKPYQE